MSSRTRPFLAVAALGAIALLAACVSVDQQALFDKTNAQRSAKGVRVLLLDGEYSPRAQAHADKMARAGAISHTSLAPDLAKKICAVAENVAKATTVDGLIRTWMNSTVHRDNLLRARYDHVGIGITKAGGFYWGVQMFLDRC